MFLRLVICIEFPYSKAREIKKDCGGETPIPYNSRTVSYIEKWKRYSKAKFSNDHASNNHVFTFKNFSERLTLLNSEKYIWLEQH